MSEESTFRSRIFSRLIILALTAGIGPALFNFYIDPYGFFFDWQRSGRLAEVAEKSHYPLWKLSKYQNGKHDTIILGDSRARALRDKYWHSFQFSDALNLAYGGGTIPEIYETFKQIKNDNTVKNLIIGIQLRSFDEDHKRGLNRVPEAVAMIENPVDYIFNWSIAKTSLKIAKLEYPATTRFFSGLSPFAADAHAAEKSLILEAAEASKPQPLQNLYHASLSPRELPEKFEKQVRRNAKSDWQNFEFSMKYWSLIEEIGKWAKEKNRNLVFVIPPTIVEMQQTIADYGLGDLSIAFRERLSQHGLVLDFDYPNDITRDIGNFNDAYHFNAKVSRQMVGEIISTLSTNRRILQRVEKRRKSIRCPGLSASQNHHPATAKILLYVGRNCLSWSRG